MSILRERSICQEVIFSCLSATQKAAIAAFEWIGKGDKHMADDVAVNAMREELSKMAITGKVVIGEGEMDEAPMLYIGEVLGRGKTEIKLDIAVDPLEGTTLCAKNLPNSLTTIAIAEAGSMLCAPDCYMNKIAAGEVFEDGVLDLDNTPSSNLKNLARYKKCDVSDLTVVILDRARHEDIIAHCRESGARVTLISDGDVYGVIATTNLGMADLYLGSGGAPEGVLAAAALKTTGGFMMGRLLYENEAQKVRAKSMGMSDLNKKMTVSDMVKSDVVFCATGVTDGNMVHGVKKCKRKLMYSTESIVFNSISGIQVIKEHVKF